MGAQVCGDVQDPSCSEELLSPAEMPPASHLPCRKGSADRGNTADTPAGVWAPCPSSWPPKTQHSSTHLAFPPGPEQGGGRAVLAHGSLAGRSSSALPRTQRKWTGTEMKQAKNCRN